ncbi:hypothetical protein [Corynebacterium sp. HMSC29G08]|uniref:hypothetical protein n=1 Tax=Corynebacterium sp. HMSC29G08 TaxID=1581069 RepID=UPI0008A5737A|nr:hypothetical protein [Corynebacterium sp. HMSC29G08]OFT82449.1 hypothetical protein HMPREF3101_07460 [Corynebacterium sp. HMSC29G08]
MSKFEKLDTYEQDPIAAAMVMRVVEAVNPVLAAEIDVYGDWEGALREHATPVELAEIGQRVRPLAERSFDDPVARYLFGLFPLLKITSSDVSYVVDEFEKLKDEKPCLDLDRVLDYDVDTLISVMAPEHIAQLDRFLRIDSETVWPQQAALIKAGVQKGFFRDADALQWLVSSRFRGWNRYLDQALDRMRSAPKEKAIADRPEAGGAMPIYVPVPAGQFAQLLKVDCAARLEELCDAVEEKRLLVGEIDGGSAATHQRLVALFGAADADAVMCGETDWDPDRQTAGFRVNNPVVVARLAQRFDGADIGVMEDASAVGELAGFYSQAQQRGDGIAILMNQERLHARR